MMTKPHLPRAFGGKGAAKDALLPAALYYVYVRRLDRTL